jgi:uncharacterized membrane protein YfcA
MTVCSASLCFGTVREWGVDPAQFALLAVLGVATGAYGTLIGSGGGFILVPLLLFLYPEDSTGTITSISLAVVFVNAVSGSIAYARQGRIQYGVAAVLVVAALPGSVIGALLAQQLPRGWFDALFGVLLVGLSLYLLMGRRASGGSAASAPPTAPPGALRAAAGISVGIGFLSSAFGIGGGVMHVPLIVRLLNFPFTAAAATAQFVLVFMSLSGTLTHILAGEFQTGWRRTGALSIGVILGAQLGAFLSPRVGGATLARLLSAALLLVGIRLILRVVL